MKGGRWAGEWESLMQLHPKEQQTGPYLAQIHEDVLRFVPGHWWENRQADGQFSLDLWEQG